MRINHNIQALNAYRNLYTNQAGTSKNLEKLSSGLRINRAADDAAGLAISEKMRSQIRGLKQAERNSMDGISLMQTAEGAMTEVHAMLQRMRELAVQAANDTNTTSDREHIQKEIDQLILEIDSVASKTEFNTRKLLDGSSAVDTQFREGQMELTNIKSVPIVNDPSMATGLYQVGVESVPELTYKLNQPGAGVSTADVIKISNTLIDTNASNIENVINTGAELGTYNAVITGTTRTATVDTNSINGRVSAAVNPTISGNLPAGEYTVNITNYNNSGSPVTATIEVIGPDGKPLSAPVNVADMSSIPTLGPSGEITLGALTFGGTGTKGSFKFNIQTTANVVVNNSSGTTVGGPQSVTFNDNKLQSVSVGDFEVVLGSQMVNGTTSFEVKDEQESELQLGEYSIVVSGYQLDSNGRPSATVEVFNPDGFSIGKLASLIGQDNGTIATIGTEDGKTVQIDTRKITAAGTAKIQIEAEVEISVSLVTDTNNTETDPTDDVTTAITFPRKLTTTNGIVSHGGLELEFGANVKQGKSNFDITNKALAFQIGANTNQDVMIDVPQLSTVKLGIDEIKVLDHEQANDAVFKLEKAINQISSVRSKLGATQNRLEHTINNLQTTHENLTAAESRIRDADMALEMTEFTKNNILNQSAQAMLAQANQLPQGVLQLLQG